MNRKNHMDFYEDISADANTDDSSTSDVVDDLNNDTSTNDNADDTSTGSDTDTNSSDDEDGKKPVPYSRFKEVNDGLKTANANIAKMQTQMDDLSKVKDQVSKADDKADDADTDDSGLSKEGKEILKKNGFLTKAELDSALKAEREQIVAEQQVKADISELSGWAKKEGFPEFDAKKVLEWADENFGKNTIKSKQAFKSAYLAMNEEAISEARTKRALAEAGKPKAAAEKPGASSGKGESSSSSDTKGDIKSATNAVLDRLEKEGKAGVTS